MKIIISAYACEPHKGSEPEVGWRWSLEATNEYAKVVVLTRMNNKSSIENEVYKLGIDNIEFRYFDLPKWLSFWKKGGRGVQVYAYLWEIFSFFYLLQFYKKNEFDVAQRVTFVSYRFPSFLWYFGKKFIFGPVAGGERFPLSFLKFFTFKGKVREWARMIVQRLSLADPLVLLTMHKADEIIAATKDTKSILPRYAMKKTYIKPAISIDYSDFFDAKALSNPSSKGDVIKLLYVGNLLELKGLMLALLALKNIPRSNYEFNIIGDGDDRCRLEDFSNSNNLNVNFLGARDRRDLGRYYLSHDLFVFPSLHDSGGMVVLEAKAHGLPVVVSSFGGPQGFSGKSDYVVKANNPDDFIKELNKIFSR